jgi:serine/threonine-protein kinase
MPLEPGTWLGSCEILAPLGAGGMGEVYKARDSAMKREVAIKVLPAELSRDPERIARLEREAHMIAQMSHPNIAVIYDMKRQGDLVYLVLELVPGETLAQRLLKGPLAIRDALGFFRQIAWALEATHARSIIHRDLKPENVKITPEGIVKVLDFGLAREVVESIDASDPTRTGRQLTEAGTIIGTVAYMSPEQARSQPLDKRTDIWSFGVCLYEALTGALPFKGSSAADVRANVLKEEPDYEALPGDLPVDIGKLVRRCLKKDPNQRLRDIGDARLEIEAALEGPEARSSAPTPGTSSRWLAVAMAASFLAGAVAAALFRGNASPSNEPLRRFAIELPPTEPMLLDKGPALAISSDGANLIYTVPRGDSTELRRRPLNQLEPARIPGTEGAQQPFFLAGGSEIAFFAKGQLFRLAPNESTPMRLGESPSPRGGSWLGDRIVFSPRTESGLSSTSSRGGSADSVTELAPGEKSHRWPSILEGGRRVLFTCWTETGFDLRIADLEKGDTSLVLENASFGRLAPSGHLLFVRDFNLMAAAFDADEGKIVGEAIPVLEDIHVDTLTGAAFFDVSSDGTLVYAPREQQVEGEVSGRLLSLDRDGKAELLNPVSRAYHVPRLSPSGRSLLTILTEGGTTDIWSMELGRGVMSRVTLDGRNGVAVWHPDGERIAYASRREDALSFDLVVKSLSNGAPVKRLATSGDLQFPTSWSPDGSRLAYVELVDGTQGDVWIWSERTGKSERLLDSPYNESAAVFSTDGRYLAYVSDETGEDEVYVLSVDGSSPKTRISTEGGREPAWSESALYYRDEAWMMEVPFQTESGFSAGEPVRLFEAPFDEAVAHYATYDVSKDGKRFLMVRTDEGRDAKRLIVVTNWVSALSELVPLPR